MSTDKKPMIERVGGPTFVEKAITAFYNRAFDDPIIGHFFFQRDKAKLIAVQTNFARCMLGENIRYLGKPLVPIHKPLKIRQPHFGRRQVIMKEVLIDLGLAPDLVNEWMRLEEQLKPLVVHANPC